MRLNVWQRLGAVASVLWFIGGGFWQRSHDTKIAADGLTSVYHLCAEASPSADVEKCMDQARAFYTATLPGWDNTAVTAIVPILLGWLLAYIVVWTTRWVLAGRRAVPNKIE